MDLNEKIAIVTGSTSGLGAATAQRFVELGARVVGVGRSATAADADGDALATLCIDITAPGAAAAVFDFCKSRFGPPDILVNNAGIGRDKSILDTNDDDLERYLATNLKAPFALCREAIRSMQGRGGSIVNVSSGYALVGAAYSPCYSSSKAALIGLTRSLAAEFGRDGIRVNVVAPATTVTPINRDRLDNDPWMRDQWLSTIPRGRPGEPREVANAIAFLASEAASYINGVVLPVDGGWSITKVIPHPRP